MSRQTDSVKLAGAFARAARTYWAGVHPILRRELRPWRARAAEIPDPVLRRLALHALHDSFGNLEGAAAFATFVAPEQRAVAVRALAAFQAVYDYADVVSEQPSVDPRINTLQLHAALLAALQPNAPHEDYFAHYHRRDENGYLRDLVDTVRSAFGALPAHPIVASLAHSGAERIRIYQSLNHAPDAREALARWGDVSTPSGSGMRWWETCAASASSLRVLALIAAAADPALTPTEAEAIDGVYFPWVNALHTMLDSLIDYTRDIAVEQYNVIEPYGQPAAIAAGLSWIAEECRQHALTLPNSSHHLVLLAGMTSLYLSARESALPHARPASHHVLRATGTLAAPSMLVLNLRRALGR
jgi:tetraprenyl-beta-curcumene synthase